MATGLFLRPLGAQLDDQAMRRALAIAETTASPRLAAELLASRPTPAGPVQAEAERIRRATHAEYIVVMDARGIRWSHTTRSEIGRPVSTSAEAPLSGHEVMQIDSGTLGRSARGKVPLRDSHHRIVGAVSVGIRYESVRAHLLSAIPGLLAYAAWGTGGRGAGRVSDLATAPAADSRPCVLRHLGAARRARGDAARHPRGRRRAGRQPAGYGS